MTEDRKKDVGLKARCPPIGTLAADLRGLGTPRTRQLLEDYMIGEKDGRPSAGFAVTPRNVAQCPAHYMFPAGPATPAAFYSRRLRNRNPPSLLAQIQHGFDCCDAQSASEMGQNELSKHVRCHGSFRRKQPWQFPRSCRTLPEQAEAHRPAPRWRPVSMRFGARCLFG
jgi:hypothetical protein